MRRLVLVSMACAALAVPAAALGAHRAAGDGTLVVRNGAAPTDPPVPTPVVQLKITGSVIGEIKNAWGKIVIDAGPKGGGVEVTGAGNPHDVAVPKGTSAQWWSSADGFKFRAVNGTFTILIYGSNVNLFAVGSGTAQVAGMPDMTTGDGRYSLNGDPFKSLPATPTKQLSIGSAG
jgi:hypothetical protein